MFFLKKLFQKSSPAPSETPEHAVLVEIELGSGEFGVRDERERLFVFETAIEEAIVAAQAGEFDGNEFGGGTCMLYMYGPSADALFTAIEPVLRSSEFSSRIAVSKRYGPPGAREVKFTL